MKNVFDLDGTYLYLTDGPDVCATEGGEKFWRTLGERSDLDQGRLVCLLHMTEDWPNWERHPAGDEIVYLLSGAMDLIVEVPDGERVVPLRDRAAYVVPRGLWHRGKVIEACDVLSITRGAGTELRLVV